MQGVLITSRVWCVLRCGGCVDYVTGVVCVTGWRVCSLRDGYVVCYMADAIGWLYVADVSVKQVHRVLHPNHVRMNIFVFNRYFK